MNSGNVLYRWRGLLSCANAYPFVPLRPFPSPGSGVLMAIVHPHNLRNPDAAIQRPYGVRITLKPGDPFRTLLGADWNKTHWYGSAAERDAALIEMARKHEY